MIVNILFSVLLRQPLRDNKRYTPVDITKYMFPEERVS